MIEVGRLERHFGAGRRGIDMDVRLPAVALALATVAGAALFLTAGLGGDGSAQSLAIAGYLLTFFGVAGLVAIAIVTRRLPIGEKFGDSWNRE